MQKLSAGLLALAMLTGPALAQEPLTFAGVDADANGELSFAELQAVWPDLTDAEFQQADADQSGGLSPNELDSLQPSSLKAPEG